MNTTTQILPAVAAIIFNEAGEVLLQKRKDVNQWCIISGHVEFGETVENAILWEIEEETATGAIIDRLIGVYSSPASQTYHYGSRRVQYITSYFEASLTGTIRPDFSNSETQELRFFKPDQIPADMAQINANWLTDALSKKTTAFVR